MTNGELRNLRSQCQIAADDLAVVERAFIDIYRTMYRSVALSVALGAPLGLTRKPSPPKSPGLPRCSERCKSTDAPCKQAADAPMGLCITHFLSLFGHAYANSYTIRNRHKRTSYAGDHGTCTCRLCGATWVFASYVIPRSEEYDRLQREALRTICPLKALSARAREIISKYPESFR